MERSVDAILAAILMPCEATNAGGNFASDHCMAMQPMARPDSASLPVQPRMPA